MDPPEQDAYKLNAFLGSVAGITTGLWLGPKMSRSETLWLDAFAAAGAALPFVLVYPFVSDNNERGDERLVGGLATLTLAGGVVAGWLLAPRLASGDDDEAASAAPRAGLSRDASGRWRLGLPMPSPMAEGGVMFSLLSGVNI